MDSARLRSLFSYENRKEGSQVRFFALPLKSEVHMCIIRFSDFGVSGAWACLGESVVVGRRPDNVHDV